VSLRAYSLIRDRPWYRRAAFSAGLRAAGYEVTESWPGAGRPGDVLLIWNRYGDRHERATRFEREGGTVIVAENGFLGRGGSSPKFDVHPGGPQPHHYYALALHGHNGQGRVPSGGPERLEALTLELRPLGAPGGHVLVCPNRAFGVPGRIMPADWAEKTAVELRESGNADVRVRRHPGNDVPARPLAADLEGCSEVHIWSSGAGVHALVAGIPVVCHSKFWVCKAASRARAEIESGKDWADRRLRALIMLSWSQWELGEIEQGGPFRRLLGGEGCS